MRSSRLALPLLALACTRAPQGPSDAGTGGGQLAGRFTLIATGDVGSDTDPCGCKVRPMGGVARRGKVVADLSQGPVLVVDAGDHFFRTPLLSPQHEPQARETALFLAQALRSMGAAALAVGERDLALGLPFLRGLERESGARLLAANLVHTTSGTAAFARFALVPRGGAQVGLVGLALELEPKAPAAELYTRAGLRLLPAEPALIEAAQAARAAGAELVVGLLHVGTRRARELLSRLPAGTLDLAVAAHDRETGTGLELVNGAGLLLTGERGKWVGTVELTVHRGAKGLLDQGAVQGAQRELTEIDQRVREYRSEDAGPQSKDREATVARLLKRRAQVEADLASAPQGGRHLARATLEPLDVARAEDPALAARAEAYKERLRVVNAGVTPLQPGGLTYVGAAACKSCHEKAFAQWSRTGHARAWATLAQVRQTANLDCVPCHSTGFDHAGGPRTIPELGAFHDVGCESCHGPGSLHAAEPKTALDHGRQVPERLCAECHRAQGDQKPFVFEDRLPRVLGPGHGKK